VFPSTWINRLRELAPEMAVSLQVHNSTEVAQAVEDGVADLGFLESPSVRSTLCRRGFGWDTLCVVVAPSHPWASRDTPVTAWELAEEALLVRESGSGTREAIDDALAAQGMKVTAALTLASNAALKSSATVGIGPAVLSELSLGEELRTGHLVKVEVEGLDLRRPLSVVWRGGRSSRLLPQCSSTSSLGRRPGDRPTGVLTRPDIVFNQQFLPRKEPRGPAPGQVCAAMVLLSQVWKRPKAASRLSAGDQCM